MYHAVTELCELSSVPAAGCSNKITCDSLKLVNVLSTAVRAFHKSFLRILETAVHASVSVVVYRAVSDFVFVHEVNDGHDCLRIMGCVSVDLNVEDVSTTCECMVRTLDLRLMLRSTLVVYRDVI